MRIYLQTFVTRHVYIHRWIDKYIYIHIYIYMYIDYLCRHLCTRYDERVLELVQVRPLLGNGDAQQLVF